MICYFITGSSRGIGKALAGYFLNHTDGFVVGISRNCTITHPRYKHFTADMADLPALSRQAALFFEELPQASTLVLINNAGILGPVGYVGEIDNEALTEIFAINTIAPALLCNTFLKVYSSHPAQKIIINISSGAARRPIDGWSGYCASKAGLEMFAQTLGLEQALRQNNTRIYSIAPGIIDTQMQAQIRELSEEQFPQRDFFVGLHKRGELIPAEEVAQKLHYLITHSDDFKEVLQDARQF